MYKEILESKIIQIVGTYGIVRSIEQLYLDNNTKLGKATIWYDVCLNKGYGDIVASFDKIMAARQWAKEN
jgi:hypothetical protein